MSFITKRERVFNEYDLFDLPARNEGKIKTYASCTDARAWSHFCSDKTEHLVEIIKRNNETSRPKYVPTDVIVNTLLSAKNAEITRLRHKIDEFEQMLAAYDQLELTCDQKCDIANAHAAIKAANKELDEMCLDLDLSGYTEGIDSEAFETGKSRGDEVEKSKGKETEKSGGDEWVYEKEPTAKTETKSNQIGSCLNDASTSAYDNRIDEMQETIILKDAKLSAMHNTIAVMEINVCEPYYIYADIYTALEKILCTLCQNIKYKHYLDLLTAGKDTRYIDMTGKILFKIKVLEKFCLALIAPCTQDQKTTPPECTCCRAEIVTHVETTFALTSAESKKPSLDMDNKRAQLVADIMQHQEMQEMLSKENLSLRIDDDQLDDCYNIDNYSIDIENTNRLKKLQSNYEDLLICYEKLKYERDGLFLQSQKYTNLQNECECLQNQLKEYNQLWKEKEYHKKRSEDLDKLKEKYYILSEETLDIETKLNAELEINKIKAETVDELRNENIRLEKRITESSLMFEKQKNILVCKVKECECKIMCQEQQIRSLSQQIDTFLEQESHKVEAPRNEDDSQSLEVMDKIESQKEQINNLKEAICCYEEEKQYLQEDYENKLKLMNELKFDVEDWKGKYETATQKNSYLEQYLEEFEQHINKLQDKNSELNKELEIKSDAIENLNNILYFKSQENGNLIDQVDQKQNENKELLKKITNIENHLNSSLTSLQNEKKLTLSTIRLAKQESLEVLNNIRLDDPNQPLGKNKNKFKNGEKPTNSDMETKGILTTDKFNDTLLNEIQELREVNLESINTLQEENISIKKSLDLVNRNSLILECKLKEHENLKNNLNKLQEDNDKLTLENKRLEQDLASKNNEIDGMLRIVEVTKKNSDTLIEQLNESEHLQEEFTKLDKTYKNLIDNKNRLEEKNINKDHKIEELVQKLNNMKKENDRISLETVHLKSIEYQFHDLHAKYATLLEEKQKLQDDYDNKSEEINNLYKSLEKKIEENQDFCDQIKILQLRETSANNNVTALKNDNYNIHTNFHALKNESVVLLEKLKEYEPLENELNELKSVYQQNILEKEKLQHDLNEQLRKLHKMEQENSHLNNQSRELLAHSEVLENSLIQARDKTRNYNPLIDENYDVIKREIANLKEEKLSQRQEIRNLLDKIEDSEYLINSLSEDIIARDKKITTLDNHINELEDEIRKLHTNLEDVVETGEQIRQLSYEKMDQSLKNIEAHQSKATHNMKIEITKLQDKKALLESQLSNTMLRTEETMKDKYKFIAQIKHLQNERLIMISDIKQLEVKSTGDSNLTPNSKINDIVNSLTRISKCMDNKNITLEKTLLSVQASYQLLKTKADEAKILAEKERQKIFDEKEEAKIARMHIEDQVEYLESKLKEEKCGYENIIKDMESEMLNQTLISEKIIQSKEDEILKLKDDLNVFQNKVKEQVQENKDKNNYIEIINSLKLALEERNSEYLLLQKHLESLNNKEVSNSGNQTISLEMHNNISTQPYHYDTSTTQKEIVDSLISNEDHKNAMHILPISDNSQKSTDKNVIKSDLMPNDTPTSINEVQILTAHIEPNIDFVKNVYIDYKIKRLSPSKVEQCSITEVLSEQPQEPKSSHVPFISNNDNIINIYNTETLTIPNKVSNSISNVNSSNKEFETRRSSITEILQIEETNKSFNQTNDFEPPRTLIDPLKHQVDKDFFVIYTDTESMYDYQSGNKNYSPMSYNLGFDNEATTLYEPEELAISTRRVGKHRSYPISKSDYEDRDDDSLKPKLEINLPRVMGDSPSTRTSIADKKSLDSYTKAIYVSPTRAVYSDTNISSHNNNANQNLMTLQSRLKDVLKERGQEKITKNNKKDLHDNLRNAKELNEKQQMKKNEISPRDAHHILLRTGAEILSKTVENYVRDNSDEYNVESNNGLQYILSAMQNELDPNSIQHFITNRPSHKSYSDQQLNISNNSPNYQLSPSNLSSIENRTMSTPVKKHHKSVRDNAVLAKLDVVEDYELKIEHLTRALKNIKIDYKKKIEAIKIQYDSNVKNIINEHNQGVASIQSLHEETLHDIVKIHENEIENLRSMSIEAMRKAEKLEKENQFLKFKLQEHIKEKKDEEPIKMTTPEVKRKKYKSRMEEKTLTKTNVEEYNIKPKRRSQGPCTCTLDMNTSDTIRNIFEQVDVEQRKIAEQTYIKYIANKILGDNVESLDAQELSFLHLKVCRTWKTILNKEEALQKRIDCLENELIKKQRQTQKHMAELDRKVAEEWQRLQEVREAVCRTPPEERDDSPPSPQQPCTTKKEICNCNSISCNITLRERRSAGDLQPRISRTGLKQKRGKMESNRAVLAKLDSEEGRQKKLLSDETPTRLKRSHDRQHHRGNKKKEM